MFEKITENNVSFYVAKNREIKKKDLVFYNPEAKLSRDISILIAKTIYPERVYDLNAGSGAIGIRIAKNLNLKELVFYDLNPEAIKLINQNLKENNIKAEVIKDDARKAKLKEKSLVFIDPFGSPAPFFKELIKEAKNTYFALKATDLGTLSGRYPKRAKNVYGFEIRKNPMPRETSIRTLLLFAELEANKYNKSIKPLFSYATNYYTHIFFKIIEKQKIKTKYINFCDKCLETSLGKIQKYCKCGNKMQNTKIYAENTSDFEFIKKMKQKFWKIVEKKENIFDNKKVYSLIEKAENQHLFNKVYDVHKLCKKLKKEIPKKSFFSNKGVFLSFDENTITTFKNLKKEIIK